MGMSALTNMATERILKGDTDECKMYRICTTAISCETGGSHSAADEDARLLGCVRRVGC